MADQGTRTSDRRADPPRSIPTIRLLLNWAAIRLDEWPRGEPLKAGTRLGRYDIVALVGAGGMGEVYRARDARLDRDVAIRS